MRGVVLIAFMIVWSSVSSAQETDDWSRYVVGEFSQKDTLKKQIFLIESPQKDLRLKENDFEVLRSIDRNHHVVRGYFDLERTKGWKINHDWKLNLSENSSSLYYLVTTDLFNLSRLDQFEVVKSYHSLNTYLIKAEWNDVAHVLLSDPEITHITNKVASPKVESRVIDMNLNPNRVNRIHHSFPSLNGSTETVSIQENRFDISDIDLLNRSLTSGQESEQVDNHATEMATIIAGAGNSFITGRGVAQKISMVSSSFEDAMPNSNEDYLEFGINTQNHSYGINRANEYGVEARSFDQSAYENRSLLHVFSSGNEGLEVSSDGIYSGIEGFANLTGNIKMAKNSLVVGSVDTVGTLLDFVSRGPTYDGRVKPEVVAYSVVGSSNSAALVSGVSTLLQQKYREDFFSDMPSALVKALLINSAVDVGAQGPDFITGFGNVNAYRSLQTLIEDRFYSGTVSQGEVDSFVLNVPANAVNLKVTICWTDPAANVNDFPALVNNLDLRLKEGSITTLPWVLDSNPDANDLSKVAIRGVDDLNNVEQVTIDDPTLSYTIEVEGSRVTGEQEFFIAWQYDMEDSFEWDYPTGSDNMPYNGETGSYFRWTTTKSGTGAISYSLDDVTWVNLVDDVDVGQGYWRWNNPPNLGQEVRARMQIGTEVYETDLFPVSEPLQASVGFACGDSLMLRWKPSPNAVSYDIRNLGVENLDAFENTSDTFLIVNNASNLTSLFFSIQPNLASGKPLLPNPTYDVLEQGVNCFIFSFFQSVALDTGIYLNLSLGTTYGMDRIVFERNNRDSYDVIETITELDTETYSFLDDSPNQGYNRHRVVIYFGNGERITQVAGVSYYLTEAPLKIFPNPIRSGDPFQIITLEYEDRTPTLHLIDDKGAIVHKQTIQGTQDIVPTGGLQSGIYFYRLFADGKIYTGRVLIR